MLFGRPPSGSVSLGGWSHISPFSLLPAFPVTFTCWLMTICYRRVRNRNGREEECSRVAAQVIASNEDLLRELLLRLPIKSLLKFKSVSKHWLSLISDSHFIRLRNRNSKAVSALYLVFDSNYVFVPLHSYETSSVTLEYLNSAYHPAPELMVLHQSCNGLLLSCTTLSLWEKIYFISNPTTKQLKRLPPPPHVPPPPGGIHMHVMGATLAFDPSQSHLYQVVFVLGCKFKYCDEDGFRILIYSSETGHWRVSGVPFNSNLLEEFSAGVYCNGAVHWPSETDASLYFDIREEVAREMPMPFPLDECAEASRYFGESGGHLHLVDSYQHLTTHLNIYEMKQDRSGWFLKFRVDPDVLDRLSGYLTSVVYVVRGEEENGSFLVVHTSANKVIRYNFISQTHREIYGMDSQPLYAMPPAYQYIESLCFV